MIDLYVTAARPTLEGDGAAGVRVVEDPGEDHARMGAWFGRHLGQVTSEHVVARVAAVVVHVRPGLAEGVAIVGGRGR